MALRWNNSLTTGLPWQDTQHREIFSRVDDLLEAMYRGGDVNELEKLFKMVQQTLTKHFTHEEQFMLRALCPGFAEHKAAHESFLEQLPAVKQKLRDPIPKTILDVQFFFVSWLREHILSLDRSAAKHAAKAQAR